MVVPRGVVQGIHRSTEYTLLCFSLHRVSPLLNKNIPNKVYVNHGPLHLCLYLLKNASIGCKKETTFNLS